MLSFFARTVAFASAWSAFVRETAGFSAKLSCELPHQDSRYNASMGFVQELGSDIIKRLRKQGRFLLNTPRVELANDPAKSSRSNLMAAQHTVMRPRRVSCVAHMTC